MGKIALEMAESKWQHLLVILERLISPLKKMNKLLDFFQNFCLILFNETIHTKKCPSYMSS